MKSWTVLAATAAMLLPVAPAPAAETPSDIETDIETDHVDAVDYGGPHAAVVVDPIAMSFGELGAEVDVALGDSVALSAEAGRTALAGATVVRAALGAPLFPQRFAFHGLVVRPRLEWLSAASSGASAYAVGAGTTVGYEWTWSGGATLRLGGGLSYAKVLAADGGATIALRGLRPRLDASMGWVF